MNICDSLLSLAPHLREGAQSTSSRLMVRCPFHAGGRERTPSMAISTEKPVFFCHGCKESGHVVKLLRHFGMGRDAIDVLLRSTGLDQPARKSGAGNTGPVAAKIVANQDPYRGLFVLDEELLDAYRMAPVELLRTGFQKQTLRSFEVGFDQENCRITFPLRNVYGELVGISGRAVFAEQEPKYHIYRRELIRRQDFSIPEDYSMGEMKRALLWNAHVVRPFLLHTDESVVVTEGFKACMWVWQEAYKNVVALVGSSLSPFHAEMLATSVGRVVLFLDNNEAGWIGTVKGGDMLVRKGIPNLFVARYPDEREQPDNLTPNETINALEDPEPYLHWRARHGKYVRRKSTTATGPHQ